MKFKILILFVLSCFPSLAKDSTQVHGTDLGFEISASKSRYDGGSSLDYVTSFFYRTKKIHVSLGFLLTDNNYGDSQSSIHSSWGGAGTVRFYPNKRGNKISFFFVYETKLLRFKHSFNYCLPLCPPEPTGLITKIFIENYLGYGFDYKILPKFSLSSNFGLGYYRSNSKSVYSDPLIPAYGYNENVLSALLKIGLEINIQ